jgi:hypothetical protein
MKIMDELAERIEKAEKSPNSYAAYVTLYHKDTGASKLFPAIDAADAIAMPNSKWLKSKPAPVMPVEAPKLEEVEAVAEIAPEPVAEPAAESAPLPKRQRRISLDSQE